MKTSAWQFLLIGAVFQVRQRASEQRVSSEQFATLKLLTALYVQRTIFIHGAILCVRQRSYLNCGKYGAFCSNILSTISRISASERTAADSGSWAMA